jgi:short-subunit dehydrogenase
MAKVVLITGISSGFGKATAEFLVRHGYLVYGTSRKKNDSGSVVNIINMDITNTASVKEGVNGILNKEGRIDILINNAGMGISGAIEDVTNDEAKLQMDTNFYGMVHVIQAVLPAMRKQGNGTIINISSIGGLMGLPFQGFYAASKFAVEGMSESLRMELKQFNINVVLINPGDFFTNFTSNRQIISKAGNDSPYEAQFRKTLAVIEKDETGGLRPAKMAQKIFNILEKKKPCPRYIVSTFEQKLAVVLKYILPDAWFFKILEDHYGIK